jgi:hypothetical protein
MNKLFQKLILIGSITVVIATNCKAQAVVNANCKQFTLTPVRVIYLKRFADPVINKAVDSGKDIQFNSTADIIVAILSSPKAPKVKPQFFTSK